MSDDYEVLKGRTPKPGVIDFLGSLTYTSAIHYQYIMSVVIGLVINSLLPSDAFWGAPTWSRVLGLYIILYVVLGLGFFKRVQRRMLEAYTDEIPEIIDDQHVVDGWSQHTGE